MMENVSLNKNAWVTTFIFILMLFLYKESEGQEFILYLDITTNVGYNWDLTIGMSPCATDGYDMGIDSGGLPPPPGAAGVILFSGGDYYIIDIIASATTERNFQIHHAFGSPSLGIDTIFFSWDTTGLSDIGTFILKDQIGGFFLNLDMTTTTSYALVEGSLPAQTGIQINVIANEVTTGKTFRESWNFLSLPLKVNNRHYLHLFPNATPGTLLQFDGSGYVPTDSLKRGKGYWLKFSAADSVSITGGDFGTVEVALDSGWNMIGGVSRNVPFDKINDPNDIVIPGTLFGFDGVYTSSDTIRPGDGYWVRTFAAGQVTVSCVASLQGFGKSLAAPISLEGFPSLTLSDAGGVSQTLYFNVKLDNPRQKLSYSLPPKMSGIFDARFAGDYRISESDEAIIEIQATAYPLTITAENLPKTSGEQYALVEIVAGAEGEIHPLNNGEIVVVNNPLVKQLKLGKVQNVPTEFALYQNYPNPFNPITNLRFRIADGGFVELKIYDVTGRLVRTLLHKNLAPGSYTLQWDGTNDAGQQVASGVYIYRISAKTQNGSKNFVQMKKMLLIR